MQLQTISVLIMGDSPAGCKGLRHVLEGSPDIRIAGEIGNGRKASERVGQIMADVVLLDARMPEADGIQATAEIRAVSLVWYCCSVPSIMET